MLKKTLRKHKILRVAWDCFLFSHIMFLMDRDKNKKLVNNNNKVYILYV